MKANWFPKYWLIFCLLGAPSKTSTFTSYKPEAVIKRNLVSELNEIRPLLSKKTRRSIDQINSPAPSSSTSSITTPSVDSNVREHVATIRVVEDREFLDHYEKNCNLLNDNTRFDRLVWAYEWFNNKAGFKLVSS